jgi:hypothetical protein
LLRLDVRHTPDTSQILTRNKTSTKALGPTAQAPLSYQQHQTQVAGQILTRNKTHTKPRTDHTGGAAVRPDTTKNSADNRRGFRASGRQTQTSPNTTRRVSSALGSAEERLQLCPSA